MPIVLKLGHGQAKFDPIATTVNGGPALIQGNLGLDKDHGVWFRLDESRIDNAAINDAVSSSVLAFIAPVLSRATEVSGKVTVVLAPGARRSRSPRRGRRGCRGSSPSTTSSSAPARWPTRCSRSPGRPRRSWRSPSRSSSRSSTAGSSSRGCRSRSAGGNKVDFAGSVGFDKTLQVKATVPITAAMIGRDAQLEKLLDGLKVDVPIGGTLARPAIDRRGLQAATRDAIRTVASQGLKNQAGRLVERVAGAKLPTTAPPAGPPPPTPSAT